MKGSSYMIILGVTGCDGVGKTTLVSNLEKKTGFESKHFDKPKDMKDGKEQYFGFLNELDDSKEGIILDRFHEGEWVYAPLYRGYEADYMRELEREITKKHNFLHVYVKAELETIIERTRIRGEDFVKEEHFQVVLNYFDEYMNKQALPYIEIDTTHGKGKENTKRIVKASNSLNNIWNAIRECECPDAILTPAFPRGNLEADIMIIGQNPGGKGKANVEYSTTWCDVGLSTFMMNVTKEAGIHRNSWYTNLVPYPTVDNKITKEQIQATEHIIDLEIKSINPKVIIALGNIAYQVIKEKYGQEYEVIKRPHPAYVKRFFAGKDGEYEKYIESFKIL
ncbi:SPBc2 prophage-derived uncharacterized protein YorR [compost metagenome]